jgi:hypothetical protein
MKPIHIKSVDLVHIAWVILHGGFEGPGGCSCDDCKDIREHLEQQRNEEAAAFYEEHYPPAGGLL